MASIMRLVQHTAHSIGFLFLMNVAIFVESGGGDGKNPSTIIGESVPKNQSTIGEGVPESMSAEPMSIDASTINGSTKITTDPESISSPTVTELETTINAAFLRGTPTRVEIPSSSSVDVSDSAASLSVNNSSTMRHSSDTVSKPISRSSFEFATAVTLVPLDTATQYRRNQSSIFSAFKLKHRRKICNMTQEFVQLQNTEYQNFIFDAHLYKFEYSTGAPQVSIAIQCPTKSFPRVYLRIPASSDTANVVTVIRKSTNPEYTFNLVAVQSIDRVFRRVDFEAELRENPIFSFNASTRWNLCKDAHDRFKYDINLRNDPLLVGPPGIYEVKYENRDDIIAAIECPTDPTMYLSFSNSDNEIMITFENVIEDLIEGRRLSRKNKLIRRISRYL